MKQKLPIDREKYLGIEQSTGLKGLLALGALLAHTVPASGLVKGSALSPLFGSLGYLCVAAFFFLSGYGIMAQYQSKKEQYLKGFLRNRVLSIYLLTLFLVLLYGIFHILVGDEIPVSQIWQSLSFGNTIVSNGWYLQIVLLFYIFWYLTTKYIQKERVQFCVLSALVLGYMLLGVICLSHFWFQSSLGFLLGVFWKQNKQKLDEWLFQSKKNIFSVLAVDFVAFAATYLLATIGRISNNANINNVFRTVMSCLSALLFVVVVLMLDILCGKVLNWGALRLFGSLSMEIYVLQGIPLHVFATGALKMKNGWLYIVCVVGATVLLAVAMHPVIRFITNLPKKYLQRGGQ